MARAVATIPQTAAGERKPTCTSCVGELADSALRCNNCKAYIHLRCSGVPVYLLVRFSFTQAVYNCAACVKAKDLGGDEDKFSDETTKIEEIIAKETSIIELAEAEANRSSQELGGDDAAREGEETATPVDTSAVPQARTRNHGEKVDTQNVTKNAVCRYFLRQECRHGIKGKDCKFDHPALCFKYTRNGTKNGGCKNKDCKYFHPKLCANSLKERECFKNECRFYHVKGTKRKPDAYEIRHSDMNENRENVTNNNANSGGTYSQAVRTRRPQIAQIRETNVSNATDGDYNGDASGFLEMQDQLRKLATQISQLTLIVAGQRQEDRCCPRTRER